MLFTALANGAAPQPIEVLEVLLPGSAAQVRA